ncbi:hypothetical protein [Pediococcus cellicola]|uniref:Uncharacterized protein n=1 Tax=Pediococcus cellicola TaxID=319652 RepID=A0A0R2IUC9_9LACO|nr:hypothetical protein [Pediococcus cellicola]KRN67142.1 hypothetical protein IV80_GL000670 [Pediococcus cellicola]GEL14779.1 hypothetical protein PCE01_05810 [Pediococcus cellicola]
MSNLVSITQLDSANQAKAVRTFAKFYIRLYKAESLEIISSFVPAGYLSDINAVIKRNLYLTKEELLDLSLSISTGEYLQVMQRLDQKYNATGTPETPWRSWLVTHHKQLVSES